MLLIPKSPERQLLSLAAKAQRARLNKNWSRKTLAAKTGLSESTIQRFERSGVISTQGLLQLLVSLGCIAQWDMLFTQPPPQRAEDIVMKHRERGRL